MITQINKKGEIIFYFFEKKRINQKKDLKNEINKYVDQKGRLLKKEWINKIFYLIYVKINL